MTTQPADPIDDIRVREIDELITPEQLFDELPVTPQAQQPTRFARQAIHRILAGGDDRLIAIVGPCSVHDVHAAMEYAKRLRQEAERLKDDLLIVMRVYFEKPRTTVGWKGLINDPGLDNTFRINDGLQVACRLLVEVNELGVPTCNGFLDPITPQYLADLAS